MKPNYKISDTLIKFSNIYYILLSYITSMIDVLTDVIINVNN